MEKEWDPKEIEFSQDRDEWFNHKSFSCDWQKLKTKMTKINGIFELCNLKIKGDSRFRRLEPEAQTMFSGLHLSPPLHSSALFFSVSSFLSFIPTAEIIQAEEKESFTFSLFPLKTPRFGFHWPGQGHISILVVRGSVVWRGTLAQPKLHDLRVFWRKNWSAITPTENKHRAAQRKRYPPYYGYVFKDAM